ncbi:MAG: LpxL/LpxP family Kdo(2)-lipid IV(A) lauroyl/palmitoleoyl acyltransferase [Pseudomonadota bacterium]
MSDTKKPRKKKHQISRQDTLDPRFLHPRYWHIWILFGLGWSVAQLPFPLQLKLGRAFGRLLLLAGKERAHITRRNIDICLPHLTDAQKNDLVRANFESVGIGFIEIAMAYWGSSKKLHRIFKLNGREHLDAAKAAGKGIIIMGGHMTSLELLLRLFCESWPCAAMYKPNHNAFFEQYSFNKRARYVNPPIPNKNLRSFLKHLKNGGTAIYLSDQDYGMKNSVFAPFFGVPAVTIKRPPEYVQYSGALVMPVIFGRNADDSGYYVDVMPPLDYPTGDDVRDATTLNYWVEQNILRSPDQYLWQHRRFKRRPPGEPPLY